jgi:hypothetical protein
MTESRATSRASAVRRRRSSAAPPCSRREHRARDREGPWSGYSPPNLRRWQGLPAVASGFASPVRGRPGPRPPTPKCAGSLPLSAGHRIPSRRASNASGDLLRDVHGDDASVGTEQSYYPRDQGPDSPVHLPAMFRQDGLSGDGMARFPLSYRPCCAIHRPRIRANLTKNSWGFPRLNPVSRPADPIRISRRWIPYRAAVLWPTSKNVPKRKGPTENCPGFRPHDGAGFARFSPQCKSLPLLPRRL